MVGGVPVALVAMAQLVSYMASGMPVVSLVMLVVAQAVASMIGGVGLRKSIGC